MTHGRFFFYKISFGACVLPKPQFRQIPTSAISGLPKRHCRQMRSIVTARLPRPFCILDCLDPFAYNTMQASARNGLPRPQFKQIRCNCKQWDAEGRVSTTSGHKTINYRVQFTAPHIETQRDYRHCRGRSAAPKVVTNHLW